MRRPVALLAVVALTACSPGFLGGDDVYDAPLDPVEVTPVAGPAYVEKVLNGRQHTLIHTPTHTTRVPGVADVYWRADGRALVVVSLRARLLDPTTGRWLSAPVRTDFQYGVAPESLTTLHSERPTYVTVYDADLSHPRTIVVPAKKADSDQIGGVDAQFQLFGDPVTLDGVTWVEWGVNSEDEDLTDHGVFRIEGDRITQALRNEPIVALDVSSDGGALLAVMQDNGEDTDCGGCQVEQRIVELDPADGSIAADYGMPDDYDRSWRIGALDKIGDTVAVQFVIREGESGGRHETWGYDGTWTRVDEAGSTRTRFQSGGELAWDGDTGEENRPYELTWHPSGGDDVVVRDRSTPCPTDRTDWQSCPTVRIPGSLLPLDGD